jgi:hypothetical protein
MPIPQTAVFRRGEVRIVIDGSLGDWPALPPVNLDDVRQVSGTALGAFRSLADLAGRVFLCWDEEDLYLAAVVQDDWHIRLPKERQQINELPPADSLTVLLDPLRDTHAIGNDRGRVEDVALWLADVEGQGNRLVHWDRLRGEARFGTASAAVVLHDGEAKLTTYEARIPWSELLPKEHPARPGAIFDVNFVLTDFDDPTDPLPQTRLGWTFGMGPRIDPGTYGSMLLLDQLAVDAAAGALRVPAIPPANAPTTPPVPLPAYWVGLANRVLKSPLAFVEHDTPDPAFVGGAPWNELLVELDGRLAEFPRVDFLDFQVAIHRRMNRECAGIVGNGLPYFWDYLVDGVVRRAKTAPPAEGLLVTRLPQSGWLVRSKDATLLIDPAGYRIDDLLGVGIDFVILTDPLDPAKRNDQLLIRAALDEKPPKVLTHLALSLPGVEAGRLPLFVPGQDYQHAGLSFRPCGRVSEEGLVARSIGYRVRWPDGTVLAVSGTELLEETVDKERGIDCLLLSVLHPYARTVGNRLGAKLTLIDDTFRCADLPGANGRAPLADAFTLQNGLRPNRSVVLMPGQSIEIQSR